MVLIMNLLRCHHCQELAPIFTEVADEFAAKES